MSQQKKDREAYVSMVELQRTKREVSRKRQISSGAIAPARDDSYVDRVNREYDARAAEREERLAKLDYQIRRR